MKLSKFIGAVFLMTILAGCSGADNATLTIIGTSDRACADAKGIETPCK